jgi:hypothetical protein
LLFYSTIYCCSTIQYYILPSTVVLIYTTCILPSTIDLSFI